jgi:hypothetical protein
MDLTPEERERRAERSRRNGACSRGPTSSAGRDRVKLNALSDGLTAKTFPLPFEREAAAQRTNEWQTGYQCDSPAAVHLANECARATIVADRCHRFREARCERQVKNTQRNWNRRRRRRVERLVKRGAAGDRLAALSELGTFSHGCRFVARELGLFIDVLQTRGYLEPEDIESGIFYQGIWPVAEVLATNDLAYTLHTLNLAGTPGVTPEALDAWLAPANRPEGLRALDRDQIIPADPRQCAARLIAVFTKRLDDYQNEADKLHREVDLPELNGLIEEAEILDEADARKVRTSHAEARTSFHRALKDLYHTLDRDREQKHERSDCMNDTKIYRSNEREAEAGAAGVAPEIKNEPRIPPDAPAQVAEARGDPLQDRCQDHVGPSGAATTTGGDPGPRGPAVRAGAVSAPARAPTSGHRGAGPRVRPR